MLQAYVDESGGTQRGNILLLAACVLTYDEWVKFSDDWQAVLDAEPRISTFHFRDARKLEKEFRGWTPLARDLKVIALTEVVMRHRPMIYACWVNVDDYNRIVRPAAPPDFRDAYFALFYTVIVSVAATRVNLGDTIPIDYVFDEHGDVGLNALLWYYEVKQNVPSPVSALMGSTPIFKDDKDVLPLQAADLVAWHKRRRLEFAGKDPEVAATIRLDELAHGENELDEPFLRDLAAKFSEIPEIGKSHEWPSVFQRLKRDYRKTQRRKTR